MKKFIGVSILFFCISVSAAEPAEVLFFGGYGSTTSQMNCWKSGAQQKTGGKFHFRGFAYPSGAGAGKASAVAGGRDTLRKLAAEINAHPGKRYVIAGHSSGAALSNRLAELVDDPKRINLVNLDGFAPSSQLQSRVGSSVCWYAQGRKGLQSRNASSMKSNCKVSKAVRNNNCTSAWCLHFGVINNDVPGNLSGATFKSKGYQGCGSNIDWLPSDVSGAVEQKSTAAEKPAEPAEELLPPPKEKPVTATRPSATKAPAAQPKAIKRVSRTYSSVAPRRASSANRKRPATARSDTDSLFRHPLGQR